MARRGEFGKAAEELATGCEESFTREGKPMANGKTMEISTRLQGVRGGSCGEAACYKQDTAMAKET